MLLYYYFSQQATVIAAYVVATLMIMIRVYISLYVACNVAVAAFASDAVVDAASREVCVFFIPSTIELVAASKHYNCKTVLKKCTYSI